jgi:hypothetical protein
MAKVYTEILPAVFPAQGIANSSGFRDRKLLTFQAPHDKGRNEWTTAYGSDADSPTRLIWVIPTGVSKAKFELWGGGGHGAGASCCQMGAPGGSGAYAHKEIDVTPGERYVLCLGNYEHFCCTHRACCSGMSPSTISQGCMIKQIGHKGATAWVSGSGLTNFCAEGGNPGVVAFCPGTNCHDVECRSCCYCWTTCEFFTGGPAGTTCSCYSGGPQIRTLDSDNDIMRCACYFGADGGERGTRGYMRTSCCGIGANANMCGGRIGIPWAGGYWDRPGRTAKGGLMEILGGMCCHCCGGYGSPAAMCALNGTFGGNGTTNHANMMRGMGGISSVATDGTTCCGQRGGPSAIWISYC